MSPRHRIVSVLLGFIALCAAGGAQGHATQLSSSRLVVTGNEVAGTVEMNARDVDAALGAPAAEKGTGALRDYLAQRLRIRLDGGRYCAVDVAEPRAKDDHTLVDARWRCPPVAGRMAYEVGLFTEIDPAARHVVTVSGDVKRFGLLGAAVPTLELTTLAPTAAQTLGHYFGLGVEHIAIGFDHIAFVVAVILWGRHFWPLAGVVTAFTVAHTLTLGLAVLDVVSVPSPWVEVLIALSIVVVAAENFLFADLRHRAWQTFLFGLVHGFGFASVLREYGLPDEARLPALAAFNVGVEAGQLAIVAAVLLVFRRVRTMLRRGSQVPLVNEAAAVRAISAVLALLGIYWTVLRVAAVL